MRVITTHVVTEADTLIGIIALEPSTTGGAPHHYVVDVGGKASNTLNVHFQNGPVPAVGVNGVTNEVLLAVVIDRLQQFQAGQFPCRENALALTKLEEAMHWLQQRTRSRIERGVEGSYKA